LIPNSDECGQRTFENGELDWIYWEEVDDDKEEDEYTPERCSKKDNGRKHD